MCCDLVAARAHTLPYLWHLPKHPVVTPLTSPIVLWTGLRGIPIIMYCGGRGAGPPGQARVLDETGHIENRCGEARVGL